NNLDELFMLMHFLDAGKFGSLEEFQQEFEDISQEEQVGRLHKMLAPHLLRNDMARVRGGDGGRRGVLRQFGQSTLAVILPLPPYQLCHAREAARAEVQVLALRPLREIESRKLLIGIDISGSRCDFVTVHNCTSINFVAQFCGSYSYKFVPSAISWLSSCNLVASVMSKPWVSEFLAKLFVARASFFVILLVMTSSFTSIFVDHQSQFLHTHDCLHICGRACIVLTHCRGPQNRCGMLSGSPLSLSPFQVVYPSGLASTMAPETPTGSDMIGNPLGVKKDVMKELPPKKELILRVELRSMQKEYYKAILTRNYQMLSRRGGAQISLNNVVMELRKVCAHPYMLEGVEPQINNVHEAYRQLLEASGKLHLLDKMMLKLKEQGHRVLIYSQFQHMLDILEDYLSYKKWSYERIDGKVSGVERQIRIDRFNASNSTRFCFILSTRAGGLGINLATADTVIIYDSDWNPHADLQAMARAHRLGQTNKVMIFRLVTRGTIDERMMQLTKKKMILEHLVVGRLKTQVLNQEELDDILRYGAKELFADENDESGKARQIHYDDAAIDRLLDRSQVENEEVVADEEEENGFLKAFKVANFEYIDEEEAEAARAEEARKQAEADRKFAEETAAERARYWDDLLKDKFVEHKVDTFTELGKGKRSRKQLVAIEEDDLAGLEDVSSDNDEEDREADWMEAEASGSGRGLVDPSGKKPQPSRKRTRGEPPPLMERGGKSFKVLGFTQNQRATFVQILMRFGLGNYDWSEFIPRMKQKTPEEIKDYATLFLSHISEEITESPTFSDGVPKEGLRIQDVLVRLALLHLIRDKVTFLAENPGVPLFSNDIYSKFPGLKKERFWKEEHDSRLLQAILKHGFGRWQAIAEDHDLGFQEVIRMELQLQLPNSSTLGASMNQDAGAPPAAVNKGPHIQEDGVEGHMKPLAGSISGNVTGEAGEEFAASAVEKGNQLNQAGLISSENSRDVLRRLVEFVRKRVSLLEKALNIEYYKELIASHKESETENEEPEHEPPLSDVPSPVNQTQTEIGSFNVPLLLPIGPEEVLTFASDTEANRLEIARLYNEMCKVVNENEQESVQTYTGNKSAGLRLRRNLRPLDSFCEQVRNILKVQQTATDVLGLDQLSPPSENGDDADARSDDPEHDFALGAEVNSDSKQHFTDVKGLLKKSGGVHGQTISPAPSAASILSRGFQTGQEKEDRSCLLFSQKREHQDMGVIVLDD
ncbi:hypothetical protein KI387_015774, partial [Taxus chinensis]